MAEDGPKHRRREYGYQAHQRAGLPWQVTRPPSEGEMNARLRMRQAQKTEHDQRLARILANNPDARFLVEQWGYAGWTPEQIIRQLEKSKLVSN
jgi:hypothetical protein